VAVTAIARDIPLSNQRFSALQSAFLLSYAFMYLEEEGWSTLSALALDLRSS